MPEREVRVIWNSLETKGGADQKTDITFHRGNNHVDIMSRCLVIDQQLAFRLNRLHIKKNTKKYLIQFYGSLNDQWTNYIISNSSH